MSCSDFNERFLKECKRRNKRPADLKPEDARDIASFVSAEIAAHKTEAVANGRCSGCGDGTRAQGD